MRLHVQVAPKEHLPWMLERLECSATQHLTALEAVDSGGRIRGMVGFDMWMPNSAFVHVALDSPIAFRALGPAAAFYLFNLHNRRFAFALISTDNLKSLTLAQRFGLQAIQLLEEGYAPGVGLVLLRMDREVEKQRRAAWPPKQ